MYMSNSNIFLRFVTKKAIYSIHTCDFSSKLSYHFLFFKCNNFTIHLGDKFIKRALKDCG